MSTMIYRPGEGRYLRLATAGGLVVVAAWGTVRLMQAMWQTPEAAFTGTIVCTAVWGVCLWFAFHVVNTPRCADFLIATEAELRQTRWPSWTEFCRGIAVALVVIALLAALLFAFDVAWAWLLKRILS